MAGIILGIVFAAAIVGAFGYLIVKLGSGAKTGRPVEIRVRGGQSVRRTKRRGETPIFSLEASVWLSLPSCC